MQIDLPIIVLGRPTDEQVDEVVSTALRRGHNYNYVGSSTSDSTTYELPQGWRIIHRRLKIGYGNDLFEHSQKFLQEWGHFQLGWTHVNQKTPITTGGGLAVCANTVLWTVNPLKIVYVRAENLKPGRSALTGGFHGKRFTFAQGCLKGHLLAGEEKFVLEWNKQDDSVWYEVHSFSKPAHPLAVVTYPVIKFLQDKFWRDSSRRVAQAAAQFTAGGDQEQQGQ